MNDAKSASDIERLCGMSGPTGVLWRLIRDWNPDAIKNWMIAEDVRGTEPMLMAHTIGAMFGTVAYVFGTNASNVHGVNPRVAVEQIIQSMQVTLQGKIDDARRTPGGIIDPTAQVGGSQ